MQVFNVRAGFATNSSSSHSIVMLALHTQVRTQEYEPYAYGWEQFTLADAHSKSAYFAVQLREALEQQNIPSATALQLVKSWLGPEHAHEQMQSGHVDHQSLWHVLNGAAGVNPEFVRQFHAWIQRSDVVILGGNDNSEGQTPPDLSYENHMTRMPYMNGAHMRVKQDGA